MRFAIFALVLLFLNSCGMSNSKRQDLAFLAESESVAAGDVESSALLVNFDRDSAYQYIFKQVEFGPRVPNTEAHRRAGDWLAAELRRHGAKVTEQSMKLKAFDGTVLNSRNIFGQFNPDAKERILLLAHWDCRPWADQESDPGKRKLPVDGANDGASGVGVLLEVARQLNQNPISKGVDILFVDAEDWGEDGDDDSWAMGTRYFMENPPVKGYSPDYAILLDMVGGKDAEFPREYFSEKAASNVSEQVWNAAHQLGYSKLFPNKMGSAIMDDHIELIKAGIPAIDIVEYHTTGEGGFNPRWHTTSDNMDGISRETLGAVGETLMFILNQP